MRAATIAAAGLILAACGGGAAAPSPSPAPLRTAPPTVVAPPPATPATCTTAAQSGPATRATIVLQSGAEIVLDLRPDKAPNTVATFVKHARECRYDNLTFHRVEPNFVAQGGDPLGTGRGGGNQPTELSDLPFVKGSVGIARGQNLQISNDMQFFICIGQCGHLDGQYTNFAQVTTGQDLADRIRIGNRIRTIRVH